MRRNIPTIYLVVLLISITFSSFAQTETFTTFVNKIKDPCGNYFIPRGVNYSVSDDWNFPGNMNTGGELSAEIIKANLNTVRIQWYVNYGQPARPAVNLYDLDSLISRFERAGIVSIIEIHDFTHIHTDTAAFNIQVLNWWTNSAVVSLIEKHKGYVMANVANEYGPALYPAPDYTLNLNYNTEIAAWVTHYKNIISAMRAANITVPIIIDAPNYGMDYQTVIDNADVFNNHDPLHRIIMSCHAYWNGTSADLKAIINSLRSLSVPVILGEVGNVDFACNPIEMDTVLSTCQAKGMGWLAWTWNRDNCAQRNMTLNDNLSVNDGKFSTLTAYGQKIVNNATFGLATHADKADFSCLVGINEQKNIHIHVFPNPVENELYVQTGSNFKDADLRIIDINGKTVLQKTITSSNSTFDLTALSKGMYMLHIKLGNESEYHKIVKN